MIAIAIALGCLVGSMTGTAQAGGATSAALGLGAFAVFNQIIGGIGIFGLPWAYPAPAYGVSVYAASAPTYYFVAAPRPSLRTEVVYSHGRYVLRGDGVSVAYRWVWIPNAPPPPPVDQK